MGKFRWMLQRIRQLWVLGINRENCWWKWASLRLKFIESTYKSISSKSPIVLVCMEKWMNPFIGVYPMVKNWGLTPAWYILKGVPLLIDIVSIWHSSRIGVTVCGHSKSFSIMRKDVLHDQGSGPCVTNNLNHIIHHVLNSTLCFTNSEFHAYMYQTTI